jgi:hemerythrin superfamily protein
MTPPAEKDACNLLDADHKKVAKLFKDYDALGDSKSKSNVTKKSELAMQICRELTVHATLEEEIFYPAVRAAVKDDDMMNEAEIEHSTAKNLIAQIEASDASDDRFDAKVTVLHEYIEHHVKEEREEMFPKARGAKGLDLVGMCVRLETRKAALLDELAPA